MRTLIATVLVAVGLLNLYPLIGVISAEQLAQLYGTRVDSPDLQILMRHRAILFGLLGALLIYSVFDASKQLLACAAGLVSMLSFVAIAYLIGGFGAKIQTIVIADILGSLALVVVLALRRAAGHV